MIFLLSGLALLGLAVFALIRTRRTPGEEGDSLAVGAGIVLCVGVITVVIAGTLLLARQAITIAQAWPWWQQVATGAFAVGLAAYLCSFFMFELCGVIYRWARGKSDQAEETPAFWARRHVYAAGGMLLVFPTVMVVVAHLDGLVHPAWGIAGVMAVLSLYQPWAMPWLLYFRGRELGRDQYAEIHRWLADVVERYDVPKFHLRVQEGRMVNALATGGVYRHFIVVGRGLLDAFSADHLKAILAHEIGHVVNRDLSVRYFPVVFVAATLHALYLQFVVFSLERGAAQLFTIVAGFLVVQGLLLLVSRRHEFDADRKAVEIMGDAEVVAQALERFCEVTDSPMDQKSMTHPTMQARVDAIRRLDDSPAGA